MFDFEVAVGVCSIHVHITIDWGTVNMSSSKPFVQVGTTGVQKGGCCREMVAHTRVFLCATLNEAKWSTLTEIYTKWTYYM